MAKDVTLTVRVSEETNARLVKLIGDEKDDDKAKKSVLLREALELGLSQIEARIAAPLLKEMPPGMTRGYAAIWSGDSADKSGWVASDSVSSLASMVEQLKLPPPQAYTEVFIKPTPVVVSKAFEEGK